ncbi:hypothetical protein F5Y17DRAFT_448925 [Xylariaceae sp. FL0594]|nr:hypothetical protein F5Y17DRAFT_448925 [Xylariaceae sp. FL0594]
MEAALHHDYCSHPITMPLSKAYPGWRLTGLLLSVLSVLLTIDLSIILAVYSKLSGFRSSSILFEGSCEKSSSISLSIHLAINVVSAALLASSNFFMQVISAPTREDVDVAHRRGVFTDLGVPSYRNLWYIPKLNVVFWVVLGASSAPVHLLFNSAVLETRISTDVLAVLASEVYLSGNQEWSSPGVSPPATINLTADAVPLTTTLSDIRQSLDNDPNRWKRIGLVECLERYNDSSIPLSEYRHVIIVVSDPWSNTSTGWGMDKGHIVHSNDSTANSIWTTIYLKRGKPIGQADDEFNPPNNDLSNIIDLDKASHLLRSSTVYHERTGASLKAEYCVSEASAGTCKLEMQYVILTTVCAIFAVKSSLVVAWMVNSRHYKPLLTRGDAIESFITNPDDSTVGLCTLDRREFTSLHGRYWRGPATDFARPRVLAPRKRVLLGSSLSGPMWISYSLIIMTPLLGTVALFFANIHYKFTDFSKFGQSILNPAFSSDYLDSTVASICANAPQLVLSICYFVYNGLFTLLLAEDEWASYGRGTTKKCKTLRVTEKKGEQRSSYRLQLPYRYSLPMMAASTILRWLWSQCVYIAIYNGHAGYLPYAVVPGYGFHGVQFSPDALLVTLIATCLVTPVPFLLALRSRSSMIPVGGTCSAVVSAARTVHDSRQPDALFSCF